MSGVARANGEAGVVALCSSHDDALAAAAAARVCGPTSLAVYLAVGAGLGVVQTTGHADDLVAAMAPWAGVGVHRTATRRLLRHRLTWEPGDPTPGVTMLYLTYARPGLSADDYHRYWEREHGPRALRHHLGMWDYAQVSVTGTMQGEPVDGIAITQWPQAEDLEQRFTDGSVGTAVIQRDAARFTDLGVLARHLMEETVLVERAWPTTGRVEITDARHLVFDRPVAAVWPLLGRFGAFLDWWPGGFTDCVTGSEEGVGMTRTLTRADGSFVVERLIEHRPDEAMLQLVIDEGMPGAVESYTCRYEVRPVGHDRCRLDWYPRAVMHADALDVFGAIVDRGWAMVADGLSTAVAQI